MIFNFTKADHDKMKALLDTKELNISSVEIYIDYLNNHYNDITSEDMNNLLKKYEINEAFYRAFVKKEELNIKDENYIALDNNSHISNMKLLDDEDYLNNPYLKLISGLTYKEKDWELLMLKYEPFEGFVYDEIKVDNNYYSEETPFGFFKKEYRYPALIEKDEIWMSLNPHEINTMKEPIKHASGDVLVLGLGLGYFTYMISRKEEVKKIVVIEKDVKAINIFKKVILPLIDNKDKIEIINDDCFNYLNKEHYFNYVFSDIYHNVHDGLPLYLKLKSLENNHSLYEYWIETSLLAMIRRYLLTLYEEKVYEKYCDDDYKVVNEESDKIINKLYFYLRDYQFSSYDEFHDFLKDESLKKLAKNLKF